MAGLPLQYLLLRETAAAPSRVHRKLFEGEYRRRYPQASRKEVADSITKAMERLIARGLAVGYGHKTQHKLFLTALRLTPAGRRRAKTLRAKPQQPLPIFKGRK